MSQGEAGPCETNFSGDQVLFVAKKNGDYPYKFEINYPNYPGRMSKVA